MHEYHNLWFAVRSHQRTFPQALTILIFTVPWAPLYYLKDLTHLLKWNKAYSWNQEGWICIGIQIGIVRGMEEHIGSIMPRGVTVLRMPIKLGPKTRFGVCFFSCLGWQWISYKWGSFSVVDKYLGCTFICTSRTSGRGIIMYTSNTDLSSEQTCIVTNWLISPFTERMSLGFGFNLQMQSQKLQGSSLCRIYTLESSLCLSIQDSLWLFRIYYSASNSERILS